MSYFDDQYEAWEELGCPGDPTDIDSEDMLDAHFSRESREILERNARHGFPSITKYKKAKIQAFKNVYGMTKTQWKKNGRPQALPGKGMKAELKKLRKTSI